MGQLASSHLDALHRSHWTDLAAIEPVAPHFSLAMHLRQIGIDRKPWRCMLPEAQQLWMVPIAAGPAAQHRLRKQRLTPQGYQTLRVQIPGMQ